MSQTVLRPRRLAQEAPVLHRRKHCSFDKKVIKFYVSANARQDGLKIVFDCGTPECGRLTYFFNLLQIDHLNLEVRDKSRSALKLFLKDPNRAEKITIKEILDNFTETLFKPIEKITVFKPGFAGSHNRYSNMLPHYVTAVSWQDGSTKKFVHNFSKSPT